MGVVERVRLCAAESVWLRVAERIMGDGGDDEADGVLEVIFFIT